MTIHLSRIQDASTRIIRGRVSLILKEPFFGTLAMHLEPVKTEIYTPTCGTDGRHLYYQEEWVDKLTDEELKGVILHEVLHCAFNHFGRLGARDKMIWNLAIDFAVNDVIKNAGFVLPNGTLHASQFKDMCAEDIYAELMKNVIKVEGLQTLDTHPDGLPGAEGEGEGGGGGKGDDQKEGGSAGGGGKEKEQDMKASSGVKASLGKYDPGINDWKSIMAAAAMAAKTQGKLPAGLERMVDDLLNPKMPWRQLLAEFIININKHDYDMRRPNRRHIHNGIYFPSLRGEEVEIAIGIDTSGSISDEELKQFLAEINGIMATIRGYKLHLMGCDADVHGYVVVEYPDAADYKQVCKGRGGTDFRPVFEKVDEEGITLACLVYLTDGYGTWPDVEPGYPVLWIINNDQVEPPWGRVARLMDV